MRSPKKNANRAFFFDLRDRLLPYWTDESPKISHIVVEMVAGDHLEHATLKMNLAKLIRNLHLSPVAGGMVDHVFPGNGYTLIQMLKESHIAVHVWPESMYAHVDIVTCRTGADSRWKFTTEEIKKCFIEHFNPTAIRVCLWWY
jgi:S-adenosylmethionine decarboxylase